jgi:hypothetical protein
MRDLLDLFLAAPPPEQLAWVIVLTAVAVLLGLLIATEGPEMYWALVDECRELLRRDDDVLLSVDEDRERWAFDALKRITTPPQEPAAPPVARAVKVLPFVRVDVTVRADADLSSLKECR